MIKNLRQIARLFLFAGIFCLFLFTLSACSLFSGLGPKHEHVFSQYEYTVDPDCFNRGYDVYKCSCGQIEERNFTDPSHDFQENGITGGTCVTEAETVFICSHCGAEKTEPIKGVFGNHHYVLAKCEYCNADIVPSSDEFFTFDLKEDGTYAVSAAEGVILPSQLVIPWKHNDKAVTEIGNFDNKSELEEVIIPDTAYIISSNAFSGCASLKYNEYNSVKYLGSKDNPYYALMYCLPSIVKCVIHSDTKITALNAFYAASDIGSIVFPENISYIANTALQEKITSLEIKGRDTIIAESAFVGCRKLKNVILSDGVKEIGRDAFSNCSGIESFSLGNGVREIGNGAFSFSSLKEINIPDSCEKIGDEAFYFCEDLSIITLGENVRSIGKRAFSHTKIKEFVITDSVETVAEEAFMAATIEKITIGAKLDKLEKGLFYLSSLKEITIPSNIKTIGNQTFASCGFLKKVTIKSGVTDILEGAFYDCGAIEEIVIPGSVVSIGKNAFYCCNGIVSITLMDGVKNIGANAFYNCRAAEKIYISKSLVSIGDSAFRDSYNIKEVYIDDLTAWRNISGLENLTSYIAYDYRLYLNGNLID